MCALVFIQKSICFSGATGLCDAGRLFNHVHKFFIFGRTPCLGGTAHRRDATCLGPDGRHYISKRRIETRTHDRILAAEVGTCLGPPGPIAENCSGPSGFCQISRYCSYGAVMTECPVRSGHLQIRYLYLGYSRDYTTVHPGRNRKPRLISHPHPHTHTHTHIYIYTYICVCIYIYIYCGPGSSVGIATDYGLDGPGSNPGGDKTFCPSVGPTQPPVKWVPSFSRG